MTLAISDKTSFALGTRPAGSPVGSKIATPTMMIIGNSYCVGGAGFGDTIGDSYQHAVGVALRSTGITPTWKGNLTRGTSPDDKHRGVVGSTVADHRSGGTFDSVTYANSLGPIDVAIIELMLNDANDATLTANYDTNMQGLVNELSAVGVGRFVICKMARAGDSNRRTRCDTINAQIPTTVATLQGAGKLIAVADLRVLSLESNYYRSETSGSRLHPNQPPYTAILADALLPAVQNACGYAATWYGQTVS